jgi:small subunit ribosomal protein S1
MRCVSDAISENPVHEHPAGEEVDTTMTVQDVIADPVPSPGPDPSEDPVPVEDSTVADMPALSDSAAGSDVADVASGELEFQKGDIVSGVVVASREDGIDVDLGDGNGEAVIPKSELVGDIPPVGAVVEGFVIRRQNSNKKYVLSARRAVRERAWQRVFAALESGEIVNGTVTSATKGGLVVDIGLRAFLPESLVDVRRLSHTSLLVGREVRVRVIEAARYDGRSGDRLVVERRSVVEAERAGERAAAMERLVPGQRFTGTITAVTNFGAFVDIGGVEGLVHVSELAHGQVVQPSDVVKGGDTVDVVVLSVDPVKNKISLSRKAALTDPWKAFGGKHRVGDLLFGHITGVAPFGAFLRVEEEGVEGLEGLIHISELSRFRVEKAEDAVAVGEGVWAKILAIEPEKKRLSLSLRRALEE